MRIGIDMSQIVYGTGVAVYTRELVRALLQLDQEDRFVLFGGSLRRTSDLKAEIEKFKGNFESKVLPLSPTLADFIWNRFHILSIERLIGKVDVFHSSNWTQPPSKAFKVTTVHDLAFVKFPNETHKRIVETQGRALYWVLKEVDRIIVPTESTKKDLLELGADERKIRVIYEAAEKEYKKASEGAVDLVRKKFRIHDDYILTVGVGARKNTQRLIDAYQKSKKNYKLVVVGGNKRIDSMIRGIIYTGFVSDSDLISLYSGAKALVYPSLYEGFGLPILQAFACECPVVTSNLGSMKEVAGDAAVLVDPYDVNSIASGIDKAVNSPKTLTSKGLKRAGEFSWEKAARQTLEVYKESRQ